MPYFAPLETPQELVGGGSARFAPLEQPQALVGAEPTTETVKGLRRGINSLGSGVQGAVGQVIQPFNEQLGTGIIEDAYQTTQRVNQENAARIQSFEDAKTLQDYWDYAQGKGAEALPYMAPAYFGGLASRALRVSPMVGGVAPFVPPAMGNQAMQLQHDPAAAGMTPTQKALYSGAVGLGETIASETVPAYMGARALTPTARSVGSAMLTRPALNVAEEGVGGAMGEAFQQKAQGVYNPNQQMDWGQVKEAGIGEAIGMAPIAGMHAVPETVHALGRQGADAAQPLAEKGVQAAKDAAEFMQEQWEAGLASLPPEAKEAVATGKMRLDEAIAQITPKVDEALTKGAALAGDAVNLAEAGVNEVFEAGKTAVEGAKAALQERYPDKEATTKMADTVEAVTGVRPVADKPAMIAKGLIQETFGIHKDAAYSETGERQETINEFAQRLNSPKNVQARHAAVGMMDALAQESGVDNPTFLSLHEKMKSAEPITLAEAAQYKALSEGLVSIHARLDALDRLTKWQTDSGKSVPEASAQFSKTADTVTKAVREKFSDSKMREALAGMSITEEAVSSIVKGVGASVNAKTLTQRGLTRLANETADKYLRQLGLHNRTDIRAAIVDGITSALGEQVAKMPTHWQNGTDPSDAFITNVNNAVTIMFAGQGKKALDPTKKDAERATGAIVDYVTKLAKGEELYGATAHRFAASLVKMWDEAAYPALQHIVDSAAVELGVDSPGFQRIQKLVESSSLIKRTVASVAPHLNEKANEAGTMRTSERLGQQVQLVEAIAGRESGSAEQHALDYKIAKEALYQQWSRDGVLKGKNDAQKRASFAGVYEGVVAMQSSGKAEMRGGQGETHAHTTVGENEDLNDLEFLQKEASSVENKNGEERQHVPEWEGENNNPELGTNDVKPSEITYSGTGMFDTSKRGVSQKSADLGAPLTNMKSADFPWGMTRDDLNGVQHIVHGESGHRVAAGKEVKVAEWAKDMAASNGGTPEEYMHQAMKNLLAFDKKRAAKLEKIDSALAKQDLQYIRARAELAQSLSKTRDPGTRFFTGEKLTAQFHYYRTKQETAENLHLGPEELKMFAAREGESREQFVARIKAREKGLYKGVQNANVHENSILSVNTKDGPLLVDIAAIVRNVMRKHQSGDTGVTPLQAFHEVISAITDATGMKQTDRLTENVRTEIDSLGSKKAAPYAATYDKDLVIHRDTHRDSSSKVGLATRYGAVANEAERRDGQVMPNTVARTADGKIKKANPGSLINPRSPAKTLMPEEVAVGVGEGMASRVVNGKEVTANLSLREMLIRMLNRNGLDAGKLITEEGGHNLTHTLVADLMHDAITELRDVYGIKVDTSSQKFDDVVLFEKRFGEKPAIDLMHGATDEGVAAFTWGNIRNKVNTLEGKAQEPGGKPWVERDPELIARQDAKRDEDRLEVEYKDARDARQIRKDSGRESLRDLTDTVETLLDRLNRAARKNIDFDPADLPTDKVGKYADDLAALIIEYSPTGKAKDTTLFDESYLLGVPPKTADRLIRLAELSEEANAARSPKETQRLREEVLKKLSEEAQRPATKEWTPVSLEKQLAEEAKAGAPLLKDPENAPLSSDIEPKAIRRSEAPLIGKEPKTREQLKAADIAAAEALREAREARAAERSAARRTPEDLTSGIEKLPPRAAVPENDMAVLAKELAGEAYDGEKHPKIIKRLSEAERYELGVELKKLKGDMPDYAAGTKYLDVLPKTPPKAEAIPTAKSKAEQENVPFSRTTPSDRIFYDGKATPEQVEAHFQAHADKFVKDLKVSLAREGLTDDSGKGVSGKFIEGMKQIMVSAWAPNGVRTLDHEIWHGVEKALKDMGKEGVYILEQLHKASTNGMLDAMLKKEYADDPEALKQLSDPSERVARMWEVFNRKEGKLPIPEEARNWFQQIKDFIMDMVGWTSGEKQTENFFKYIADSGLVRDIDNPYAVLRNLGETKTDKFIAGTHEAMKPLNKMFDKVVHGGTERIRAYHNEHMDKIVDAYGGQFGKGGYHTRHTSALNRLGAEVKKITDTVKDEALLGKLSTFAPVHKSIKNYMEAVFDDNGKTFDRLIDKVSSYNRDGVSEEMEEFMGDLMQYGGLKAMDGLDKRGVARNIATKIAERGYYYHPDVKLFAGNAAMQVKWMEKSLAQQTYDLILQAGKMTERHRAFGERTEEAPMGVKMKALLDNVQKDVDGGKLPKEALVDIKEYMNAYDGKHDVLMSTEMKKLMGGILFMENALRLPFAVTSQLIEPFQLAMRKGDLISVLGSTWRGIKEFPRMFETYDNGYNKDYWERFAERAGAARSRAIGESIAQLSNGIASRGLTGKLNEMFFRYNGMEGWDRSMHISATEHAVEFLQDHANGIDPKHSERFLKELGVTAEEVKAAMTTDEQDGAYYKSLDIDNPKHENVRNAIIQYVEEALAHPDAGSNPFWMNDPRFALIAQMKRFSFGFETYVNDRNMRELEHGNLNVAPAMVASIPWALLFIDPIKHIAKGTDVQEMGFIDALLRGLSLTGQTGKAQFIDDAFRTSQYGGSAIESLLGPTASTAGDSLRALAMARASLGT